jgi:hypothetical protein
MARGWTWRNDVEQILKYKFTGRRNLSYCGIPSINQNKPTENNHGEWLPELNTDYSGYHFCNNTNLLNWVDEECWEIEICGNSHTTKYTELEISSKIKFVRKLNWDENIARNLICDYLEYVVLLRINNPNPLDVQAIKLGRKYTNDNIVTKKLQIFKEYITLAYRTAGIEHWCRICGIDDIESVKKQIINNPIIKSDIYRGINDLDYNTWCQLIYILGQQTKKYSEEELVASREKMMMYSLILNTLIKCDIFINISMYCDIPYLSQIDIEWITNRMIYYFHGGKPEKQYHESKLKFYRLLNMKRV